MSQIPSNIQQFDQGLSIANEGIEIASRNQQAKLQAEIERGKIGVAREQIGLQREQLMLEDAMSQRAITADMIKQEQRQEQELELQQRAQEFEAAELEKRAKVEAAMQQKLMQWQSDREKVRAERMVAMLEGNRGKVALRTREMDDIGAAERKESEKIAQIEAINNISREKNADAAKKFMDFSVQHERSITAMQQTIIKGVGMGKSGLQQVGSRARAPLTGTKGLGAGELATLGPAAFVPKARQVARDALEGAGMKDPYTFTPYARYVEGDDSAEGQAAVEVVKAFTNNMDLTVLGKGDVKTALNDYLVSVVEAERAQRAGTGDGSAQTKESLGKLIKTVGSHLYTGMLLNEVQHGFAGALASSSEAAGVFGDGRLSAVNAKGAERMDRLLKLTEPLREGLKVEAVGSQMLKEEHFNPISTGLTWAKAMHAIEQGDYSLAQGIGIGDPEVQEAMTEFLAIDREREIVLELARQKGMSVPAAERLAQKTVKQRQREWEEGKEEQRRLAARNTRLGLDQEAEMEDEVMKAYYRGVLDEPEFPNIMGELEGVFGP